MSYYINNNIVGLQKVIAANDGYSITLKWATAYPTVSTNKIAYNIYYSEDEITLLDNGPQFVVGNGATSATLIEFEPGVMYHFCVRATEYDPTIINFSLLPIYTGNLVMLPSTILSANVTNTAATLPVVDVSSFPTSGMVKAGVEVIRYSSITVSPPSLNLISPTYRGYLNTVASIHNTDGYDGDEFWSQSIAFYFGEEDLNTNVFEGQCRFDVEHFSFTEADGYKQVIKDILTVDLTSSDLYNVGFKSYDYAGWHRTDPVQLLNGDCVGSYIGGEQYCADGYDGAGRVLRGMSVQEQNNQRQEELLSITGEPVVLLSKQRTGIVCSCFMPSSENPDDRCEKCFGTGFISGWQQYFNPRSSDGRIMVRPGPSEDHLKSTESGLESEVFFDFWSLTVPTIKNRDIIVRFDEDDNEEFRYEVLSVTRNRMLQSLMGGQKFRVQRIRKTDPAYQIRIFANTKMFPSKLQTSITSSHGIPAHSHTCMISEGTTSISQINQITSIDAGHSHVIVNGMVQNSVGNGYRGGHSHIIIL